MANFLNEISDFITNLLINDDYQNNQLEYENIDKYDVIWATRVNDKTISSTLEPGHEEGPYIVLQKDDELLYCLMGSGSKPFDSLWSKRFFCSSIYNLTKLTYFYLDRIHILSKDDYIFTLSTLNQYDKEIILKNMELLNNSSLKTNYNILPQKLEELDYAIGDIIRYKHVNYIIISICENYLYCIKVKKNAASNKMDINSFNLNKTFIVSKDDPEIIKEDYIDKALLKKLYISLKNKCNNDIEQNFIMNLNEKNKMLSLKK